MRVVLVLALCVGQVTLLYLLNELSKPIVIVEEVADSEDDF